MKSKLNFFALAVIGVVCTAGFTSCDDNDDNGNDPAVVGEVIDLGDGSDSYELTGNMTLTYPNTYNLKGFVYVPDGKTLTIEPGVIIKGDKASKGTLIIERGGKIMAKGQKERPIVFTSSQAPGNRKPGDWGGLIVLGKAKNNAGEQTIEGGVRSKHGGNNDADNSGILSYVRVEFAGIEYSTDNEINGITFGSVGTGTQVDHLQVSYSGDDSYEWFGGKVDACYLVSLGCWDDDFDTDNGYQGRIQFAVALRNPQYADKSCSNGFESDNNSSGSVIDPTTRPIFANVSLFGPVTDPANYQDKGNDKGSTMGCFQTGVQIRRSSNCNLFNSVIAGFPIGLIIENDKTGSNTQESATAGTLNISGCVMAGCQKSFQDKALNPKNRESVINPSDPGTFVSAYWATAALSNTGVLSSVSDLKLKGNPQSLSGTPDMCPNSDSPLATGAVWSHSYVNNSFFTKTAYRGAFGPSETGSDNWMSGWTNFDPQNTVY